MLRSTFGSTNPSNSSKAENAQTPIRLRWRTKYHAIETLASDRLPAHEHRRGRGIPDKLSIVFRTLNSLKLVFVDVQAMQNDDIHGDSSTSGALPDGQLRET